MDEWLFSDSSTRTSQVNLPGDLQVGDVLFFSPSSIVGVAIAVKSWTWLSHVEGYCGGGRVIAARADGVNIYPTRIDEYLVCVRRPKSQFYLGPAFQRLHPLMTGYDAAALLAFFEPQRKHASATAICSSVITEWLRGGGCEPFNPDMASADAAPAQLWQSSELKTFWTKE